MAESTVLLNFGMPGDTSLWIQAAVFTNHSKGNPNGFVTG